jgi:chemotaxis protein histidine kinase CheA
MEQLEHTMDGKLEQMNEKLERMDGKLEQMENNILEALNGNSPKVNKVFEGTHKIKGSIQVEQLSNCYH